MSAEDEAQVKKQILDLYKIFEFDAEKAQDFGMYVNDKKSNEESSGGEPETL